MPQKISLLTIVKGRQQHLHNLVRGVRALTQVPSELVIVHMNEPIDPDLPDPGCPLREVVIESEAGADQLPIARARNHAAHVASGDLLIFLDVDCIPGPGYLADLAPAAAQTNGLVMGNPLYLPVDSGRDDWTAEELATAARQHPRRPQPPKNGLVSSQAYHLFWSLCFGLKREVFERIGGFDETYQGYAGEDTDFAFKAREAGVPFYLCDAVAYHQHHHTFSPPYNHLDDLIKNAKQFRKNWGTWPMEGWLTAFRDDGYVRWTDDELTLLKHPDEATIAASRSTDPFA